MNRIFKDLFVKLHNKKCKNVKKQKKKQKNIKKKKKKQLEMRNHGLL